MRIKKVDSWETKIAIDTRIAIAACDAELKHARMLGAGWFEAYASSYRVLDEVFEIARSPMPATVLTRFRPHRRMQREKTGPCPRHEAGATG